MAQSFSCRPLIAEVWVRSLVSPCDVCGGKSEAETGSPYQHHSTSSLYEGESKSKGKIHLTAVIEVTVSNFTYNFST